MARVAETARSRGGGKLPTAITTRAELGLERSGKTAGLCRRKRSMENLHFNMKCIRRLHIIM